jgi:hypothetical protein
VPKNFSDLNYIGGSDGEKHNMFSTLAIFQKKEDCTIA